MSKNDDNKTPKESWKERLNRFTATGYSHLHASVAAAVEGVNAGLAAAEKTTLTIQVPVNQAWQKAAAAESALEKQLDALYKRRNEIGPQIVGGTAIAGGLLSLLRRRSIWRFVSGSVMAGGLAYITVYEPIPIKKIPELVKRQFQPASDEKK